MTAPTPEVWGDGCECWVTPESMWLSAASCGYGSGYEPGSMIEYNPECPKHGESTPPTPEPPRWATTDCAGHDPGGVTGLWFTIDVKRAAAHIADCYCARPGGEQP